MAVYKVKEGCPGCGVCQNVCPVNAIVPSTGLAVKITDACIDCGVCVAACPVNLIARMEPEPIVKTSSNDQAEIATPNTRKEVAK